MTDSDSTISRQDLSSPDVLLGLVGWLVQGSVLPAGQEPYQIARYCLLSDAWADMSRGDFDSAGEKLAALAEWFGSPELGPIEEHVLEKKIETADQFSSFVSGKVLGPLVTEWLEAEVTAETAAMEPAIQSAIQHWNDAIAEPVASADGPPDDLPPPPGPRYSAAGEDPEYPGWWYRQELKADGTGTDHYEWALGQGAADKWEWQDRRPTSRYTTPRYIPDEKHPEKGRWMRQEVLEGGKLGPKLYSYQSNDGEWKTHLEPLNPVVYWTELFDQCLDSGDGLGWRPRDRDPKSGDKIMLAGGTVREKPFEPADLIVSQSGLRSVLELGHDRKVTVGDKSYSDVEISMAGAVTGNTLVSISDLDSHLEGIQELLLVNVKGALEDIPNGPVQLLNKSGVSLRLTTQGGNLMLKGDIDKSLWQQRNQEVLDKVGRSSTAVADYWVVEESVFFSLGPPRLDALVAALLRTTHTAGTIKRKRQGIARDTFISIVGEATDEVRDLVNTEITRRGWKPLPSRQPTATTTATETPPVQAAPWKASKPGRAKVKVGLIERFGKYQGEAEWAAVCKEFGLDIGHKQPRQRELAPTGMKLLQSGDGSYGLQVPKSAEELLESQNATAMEKISAPTSGNYKYARIGDQVILVGAESSEACRWLDVLSSLAKLIGQEFSSGVLESEDTTINKFILGHLQVKITPFDERVARVVMKANDKAQIEPPAPVVTNEDLEAALDEELRILNENVSDEEAPVAAKVSSPPVYPPPLLPKKKVDLSTRTVELKVDSSESLRIPYSDFRRVACKALKLTEPQADYSARLALERDNSDISLGTGGMVTIRSAQDAFIVQIATGKNDAPHSTWSKAGTNPMFYWVTGESVPVLHLSLDGLPDTVHGLVDGIWGLGTATKSRFGSGLDVRYPTQGQRRTEATRNLVRKAWDEFLKNVQSETTKSSDPKKNVSAGSARKPKYH